MKKIIVVTFVLFVFGLQAQMTLTRKQTGAQILNNDVLIFNSVGNTAASLDFYVNNTSATSFRSVIDFVSAVNATGTGMELCYGNSCLSDIFVGDTYPTTGPVVIPAMGRNGDFDHIFNTHVGNGALQDYVFRFYMVNNFGIEVGNSITFTYRYQPAMAISNFENLKQIGIEIKSNVIDNQLEILSKNNDVKFELLDINGRLILNNSLISGDNVVDVSNLNTSIYFLNLIQENGQKSTVKLIKK